MVVGNFFALVVGVVLCFFEIGAVFGSALLRAPVRSSDDTQAVKLNVSPSVIVTDTWVNVTWEGIPEPEIHERNTEEYICQQDSYCTDVKNLSVWVGVFAREADRTPIGPQTWGCANPPWLATSPIKWKPIYTVAGTTQFHMESARVSELSFVLFYNGTTYPIEVAVSNPLTFTDVDTPKHVHLARTKSAREMRVMWSAATFVGDAKVRWGTDANNLIHNVTVEPPHSYAREDLCGPPATTVGWWQVPWFYTAVLSFPTEPEGQQLYYSCGSDAHGWTDVYKFRVPTAPRRDATLKITALADLGETYIDQAQYHWMEPYAINTTSFALDEWGTPGHVPLALNPAGGKKTVSGKEAPPGGNVLRSIHHNHIEGNQGTPSGAPADVALHIGDLSYATGYETEWDRFMVQIEPIASQVPYMTMQGNHERDYPGTGSAFPARHLCVHTKSAGTPVGIILQTFLGRDSGGECGIPTQARFLMPTPSNRQDNGWYSFEQGPVHFLMMDTEMSAFNQTAQLEFFKADLAAVDRSVTPWVIFMGHRPMYSSTDSTGYNIKDGPWWGDVEAVLLQYHVDLCLWGHVHNAEVTCPLRNGTCVEPSAPGEYDAPVHAVLGNAGQSISMFPRNVPAWSLWRFEEYGYSTIEVDGPTSLRMKFYSDCQQRPYFPNGRMDCTNANKLAYQFEIQRHKNIWL